MKVENWVGINGFIHRKIFCIFFTAKYYTYEKLEFDLLSVKMRTLF